jgi:hypothetical protein
MKGRKIETAQYFRKTVPVPDFRKIVAGFLPQIETWLAEGGRLGPIVRPLLGLFHGRPGARRRRQILTTGGHRPVPASRSSSVLWTPSALPNA